MRILILLTIFLSACSSSHIIRQSNYYQPDFGALTIASGNSQEALEHNPAFMGQALFKEGPSNYNTTLHYYVWGSFPLNNEVKLSEACGNKKFRQAYFRHDWSQMFISIVTYGIYTPMNIDVWCENEIASK